MDRLSSSSRGYRQEARFTSKWMGWPSLPLHSLGSGLSFSSRGSGVMRQQAPGTQEVQGLLLTRHLGMTIFLKILLGKSYHLYIKTNMAAFWSGISK